jgi:proteasome lid subunit RPN8/RPN11
MIALTKRMKRRRSTRTRRQTLRFTPTAWAKLLYLRDIGPTEVGGFGISDASDLLLVEDIQLVEQVCSVVSVEFDDDSVADFFDKQVDAGRQPEQFARVWIHTHPGASPSPSGTDEETFERCFGGVDWALMHIIAEEGNTYTRARFNVGPGTERRLRSRVEFDREFPAADHEAWFIEYCDNVTVYDPFSSRHTFADTYYESDWWEKTASAADRWSDSLLEAVG